MRLTKNFDLSEFLVSQTAARLGIENIPSIKEVERLKLLCENVLQPFRDIVNMPIIITSGYRCNRLNSLIGSRDTSQHIKAEAADFIVPGMEIKETFELITEKYPFDQAILEFNSWIHISFVDYKVRNNRYQKLVALKDGGKTVYIPFEDIENE